MKKIIVIIAVLMALGTSSYASSVSQQWIKTYGTSNDDIIQCIQQTIDGGYIAVGNTRTDPASAIDLLIMKLDVNGNVLWQKIYPYGTWVNDAYSIQQTSYGSYIVAGFTGNVGFGAGWILNLDSNGDILWQKAYDGVAQFISIQQTTDGGYIVLGDSLPATIVIKLDSDGNVTWAKAYHLATYQQGDNIIQTNDGGYIFTMQAMQTNLPSDYYKLCILKLNSTGDIIWQKKFGEMLTESILQTSDGGYIMTGDGILKLNAEGDIVWLKGYYYTTLVGIKQNMDGEYTMAGGVDGDIGVFHLDSSGNIIWQKSYGGPNVDMGYYFGNTNDGGSIIAGNTDDGGGYFSLMLLKLNSDGEIPDCSYMHNSDVEVWYGDMTVQIINATVESFSHTVIDTNTIPQHISLDTSVVCYYEDPNDIDGDGVESNPGGMMAGTIYSSSFLADGDNCSGMPNGPYLGTCTEGNVGSTCIAHAACGANGFCSMNQEDTYPPLGNGIGDACDCEGDFSCDGDVDGSDASTFKADFGRSAMTEPCIAGDTCNGDFNCDGDADGSDASLFKSDFGRSSMQNPCPLCATGMQWCSYPLP